MKKKINYLFVILFTEIVFGQQRVGINTDTPNESTALHISSTSNKRKEAKLEAIISNGTVTRINIINGGFGYPKAPTLFISDGGASITAERKRATATTTIDRQGKITSVKITNGGSGYTSIPTVNIITENALGWALPRVELESLDNHTTPIHIESTDNDADGLLVYNTNKKLHQYPYLFDKTEMKWHEVADSYTSSKFAIFTLLQDAVDIALRKGGDYPHIQTNLFKEPVSNLPGVLAKTQLNKVEVVLPKQIGTYLVEVTFNITTSKKDTDYSFYDTNKCNGIACSKPIAASGEHLMGYFINLDTYNMGLNGGSIGRNVIRKEESVIAKVGATHSISSIFILNITQLNNSNPSIYIRLGRRQDSSYNNPVTILKKWSFIKIKYLR